MNFLDVVFSLGECILAGIAAVLIAIILGGLAALIGYCVVTHPVVFIFTVIFFVGFFYNLMTEC